jgi:hypothetical protein
MRPLTITEFAKERGVSRARVYQWIGDGRVLRLEGGGVDADAAHERLGAMLDQAKGVRRDGNITSQAPASIAITDATVTAGLAANSAAAVSSVADPAVGPGRASESGLSDRKPGEGRTGSSDDAGYWESRARREKAEAQISEMKALQQAGLLTPALAVAREARETARALRNALLAIPDELAPVLDPASPSRAHRLLSDALTRAIRECSERLDERVRLDERARGLAPAAQSDGALVR